MRRLTMLVGAGGSVELGIPGTPATTDSLVKDPSDEGTRKLWHEELETLRAVKASLKGWYSAPNFEHMLHALECIVSLERSWQPKTAEKFRVIYARLCAGPNDDFRGLFNRGVAASATGYLYTGLHDTFAESSAAAVGHEHWTSYQRLWSLLAQQFGLDVVTTNYDSLIESAVPHLDQGFDTISGEVVHRFDPRRFRAAEHRLAHLHGSIHFGYRQGGDPNRFVYEDDWEDLYWHLDPMDARRSWGSRSHHTSQAGEESIVGPLITGMQKPNKVLASEPYLTYYRSLGAFIQDNDRLLVIGYGFGDVHINQSISRMTRWHGANRKIAVITYCPEKEWIYRRYGHDHLEEEHTIMRWSEEHMPWTDTLRHAQVWTSSNGLVRIYTGGFLDTVSNHVDDLLRFLS